MSNFSNTQTQKATTKANTKMSVTLRRTNSCPGEIWCDEDKSNIGYRAPQKIPSWYEFWSALEFWYLKQKHIHNDINNERVFVSFNGMTDEEKVRTYEFLVGLY